MVLKKISLLFALTMLLSQLVNGQGRHYAGTQNIGVSFGYTKDVFDLGISYEKNVSTKLIMKGNIYYEKIKFDYSDYYSVKFNPELLYNIFSYKILYFNSKIGIISAMEFHKSPIFDQYQRIFFGEGIGANVELFINSKIKLEFDITQEFYQNSRVLKNLLMPKASIFINL